MERKDIDKILVNEILKEYNVKVNLKDNLNDFIDVLDLTRYLEEIFYISFDKNDVEKITNIPSISEVILHMIKNNSNVLIDKKPWWSIIPISINSAFGDALTSTQIEDTCEKMKELKNHNAAYGFCSKAVLHDNEFDKLRKIPITNNLCIRYSLTGLNEGGFSFDERIETINNLKSIFGKVIIITRPLIYERNTDIDTLRKLVQTAKNTSGLLITGALHDKNKRKQLDDSVRRCLVNLCDEYDVKYFHKSSCAAAYLTNRKCWMHNLSSPENIDVLDKLGYQYKLDNGKIILNKGTIGDLNFLRMVTGSYIYCRDIVSGYNILSFSDDEVKFDVTSSWYSWSRNRKCQINCDYCIIREIEYLDEDCQIGVNPKYIENYALQSKRNFYNMNWEKGSYTTNVNNEVLGYDNLRTVQKCMVDFYKR